MGLFLAAVPEVGIVATRGILELETMVRLWLAGKEEPEVEVRVGLMLAAVPEVEIVFAHESLELETVGELRLAG